MAPKWVLENLKRIMDEVDQMAASSRWIKHWNVPGTTGKVYKVSVDREGKYGCSCPTWIFCKGTKIDCQHILRKKMELMTEGTLAAPLTKTSRNTDLTDVKRSIRFDEDE